MSFPLFRPAKSLDIPHKHTGTEEEHLSVSLCFTFSLLKTPTYTYHNNLLIHINRLYLYIHTHNFLRLVLGGRGQGCFTNYMQTFCIKCQPPACSSSSSLLTLLNSPVKCSLCIRSECRPHGLQTLQKCRFLFQWEYVSREHMGYGSDPSSKNSTAEILQRACERLHQQGLGCLLEGCEGEAAVG